MDSLSACDTSPMVTFQNVSKSYVKGKKAVDGLTLDVPDGAIYGFLGPNGAGKSTTIKMMASLLLPDAGKLTIGGHEAGGDALPIKAMVGYVPDEPLFYDKMTGRQHLAFICDVYRVEEREKRIGELCALLDFHALDDEIASYSHGMKQKLSVISALVHQPKLLILDEPMVGLDPKSAYALKTMMRRYAQEGNTVFFSTHVLEVAQEVCTLVGIIDHGKLLYSGTFQDLQKGSDRTLEELFLSLTERQNA